MMVAELHDFLLHTLEENWLLSRQAEEKRATTTALNLLIVSTCQGILAFIGLSKTALFLSIWMMIIGIYGAAACAKLYERSQYHILRARKLRARLDQLYPTAEVEQQFQLAEKEHKAHYSLWMHIRLNTIWIGLHILISLLGALYTIIILSRLD